MGKKSAERGQKEDEKKEQGEPGLALKPQGNSQKANIYLSGG